MKLLTSALASSLAVSLLAGCATASPQDPATPTTSPSPVGLVFDEGAPLAEQMISAINADDPAVAQAVIDAGFDVESILTSSVTALQKAAAGDHTDVVRILLAAGADPNAQPTVGTFAPLMLAAAAASAETVTALLEGGSDPTLLEPGHFGAAPIHFAAETGNIPAIEAFLAWGQDVDFPDSYNEFALGWAANFGQADAVQYLLDNGADPAHRDDFGDTAASSATVRGFPDIAQVILDAGGVL